ncbi:MAG: hypothetical protein QGI83_09210 [Candidatus Latescibacteria bacterium]|jgi:hypothetical protein|nr:hypothetical protein [Candidatus Latescibacterota bacterium]
MSNNTENGSLRIGWASQDVTPDRPVSLRGQFRVRVSTAVRDPLTVTALALESADEQCVMVSVDRVGIPEDILAGVRGKLADLAPDLSPEKLLISATHTHAAPGTDDSRHEDLGPDVMKPSDYGQLLIDRTATCVADAWNGRSTGSLSWGCGQAVVGFNRRQVKLDGTSQMYGDTSTDDFSHIEGYEDHGVDMLFTYAPDGAVTGMVINLACPSQVTESDHLVSADFWHETRSEIRRRHGEGLYILPQCSAAGDQSPHLMWKQRAELRMLKLKGLCEDEAGRRMAERAEIGNRIANAVDEVMPLVAKDTRHEVRLEHVVKTVQLPRRAITEDDVKEAEREALSYEEKLAELADRPASDSERSTCISRARWFRSVIERHELQKTQPNYPMELHVVRVGEVVFATNAFELYLDYGLRMKARSKALQTFVVQLTGSGTYLPSARSVGGGSYGSVPASNHVGPEGGDVLVEETVKVISDLFEGE